MEFPHQFFAAFLYPDVCEGIMYVGKWNFSEHLISVHELVHTVNFGP